MRPPGEPWAIGLTFTTRRLRTTRWLSLQPGTSARVAHKTNQARWSKRWWEPRLLTRNGRSRSCEPSIRLIPVSPVRYTLLIAGKSGVTGLRAADDTHSCWLTVSQIERFF